MSYSSGMTKNTRRATLAALAVTLGVLTGCSAAVTGDPRPALDPAAHYTEREQTAVQTIHALDPDMGRAQIKQLALAACHALDVGASPEMLAEVWADNRPGQTEVDGMIVISALAYGYCVQEWAHDGAI